MTAGNDEEIQEPDWAPGIFNEVVRQRALSGQHVISSEPEERFDRITRLAAKLLKVKSSAVTIIDGDQIWIKSRFDTDISVRDRENSFSDFAIRSAGLLEVRDATKDPRFDENSLVVGEPKIRFFAGYPLEAPNGELIGVLCVFDPRPRIFSSDERSLLNELRLWVQSELSMEEEIERAARVQRGLLPQQPPLLNGYEVAGGCAHVQAVGGDFYDWYSIAEGEAFTLADVMGKGMAAAIIAATVRAVLRAGSTEDDIVQTVETATEILESDLHNAGTFVTLFHARMDANIGEVRFVDAGHGLSVLYRKDGTSQRLTSENLPLGAGIGANWEMHRVTLEPGDTLVSISDGVLDLFDGTLGGLDRVENIVRYSESSQKAVDELVSLADHSASDDATVLIIRRSSQPQ